jgi:hypothetical protein
VARRKKREPSRRRICGLLNSFGKRPFSAWPVSAAAAEVVLLAAQELDQCQIRARQDGMGTPNNQSRIPKRRPLLDVLHPAAATASIPAAVLGPSGVPRRRGRERASGLARDTLRAPGERQHDKERGQPPPRSQRRGIPHSMTSSARARRVGGIVRPSSFAV